MSKRAVLRLGLWAAGISVSAAWAASACAPVVRTFEGSGGNQGGAGGTTSTGGTGGSGPCKAGDKVACYGRPRRRRPARPVRGPGAAAAGDAVHLREARGRELRRRHRSLHARSRLRE